MSHSFDTRSNMARLLARPCIISASLRHSLVNGCASGHTVIHDSRSRHSAMTIPVSRTEPQTAATCKMQAEQAACAKVPLQSRCKQLISQLDCKAPIYVQCLHAEAVIVPDRMLTVFFHHFCVMSDSQTYSLRSCQCHDHRLDEHVGYKDGDTGGPCQWMER